MKKKRLVFLFLIFGIFIGFLITSVIGETIQEEVDLNVEVTEPFIQIEIPNRTINLSPISKGYRLTDNFLSAIQIYNFGTLDVKITPQLEEEYPLEGILRNLNFKRIKSDPSFTKIGNFEFNLSKPSQSKYDMGQPNEGSFYIGLDLTDYEGVENGNISTQLIFWISSI